MSLGEFLLLVLAFNTLALGNGPVMIPLFRRGLVEERGALSLDQLLYAFAVAQVTPGQANIYVASLGYMLHGFAGALLAVLVMVLPGYTMLPLLHGFEAVRDAPLVRGFSRGLAAVSVGLIFAATVEIGREALTSPASWAVLAVTLTLAWGLRWRSLPSLAVGSGLGLLFQL